MLLTYGSPEACYRDFNNSRKCVYSHYFVRCSADVLVIIVIIIITTNHITSHRITLHCIALCCIALRCIACRERKCDGIRSVFASAHRQDHGNCWNTPCDMFVLCKHLWARSAERLPTSPRSASIYNI